MSKKGFKIIVDVDMRVRIPLSKKSGGPMKSIKGKGSYNRKRMEKDWKREEKDWKREYKYEY